MKINVPLCIPANSEMAGAQSSSIKGFAFAMTLGVIFGTLSSIFIASPIAYLVMGRKIKEEKVEA